MPVPHIVFPKPIEMSSWEIRDKVQEAVRLGPSGGAYDAMYMASVAVLISKLPKEELDLLKADLKPQVILVLQRIADKGGLGITVQYASKAFDLTKEERSEIGNRYLRSTKELLRRLDGDVDGSRHRPMSI
jgi:hypothetical protein